MDPRKNPYAPGAGVMPPAFAGREDLIEAADIALDRRKAGLYANDIILLGLRGVGKTVLLNAIHGGAKAKDIATVKFEVPDGSGGHLARAMVPALNVVWSRLNRLRAAEGHLTRAAAALRNFAAIFKVKYEGFSFGATPATADAASGDLQADLPELLMFVAAAARDRETCLALFIDEIQYLTKDELSALARACHEAAQKGLPMILVGAGLPQIAALAGEAKSYAERLFQYPEVGALDRASARRVLVEPAQRAGVCYEDTALERIVAQTEAYPYFLQTWGKFAWDEAAESPITSCRATSWS
ncbi:MAG: ATP-binding protein [Paracoccaceae bacterium]